MLYYKSSEASARETRKDAYQLFFLRLSVLKVDLT